MGQRTESIAKLKEGSSASKILTGKVTEKRALGKTWRRWEDNIRMYLKEIGINARNSSLSRKPEILGFHKPWS